MKKGTIAKIGIGGLVAVGLGAYVAFRIGVEKGAEATADAIDKMTPAELAGWKASNLGKPHATVPMIPILKLGA